MNAYQQKLKEATWVPHLFRVSTTQNKHNNEKWQRITVRAVAPINFSKESGFLLGGMKKMKNLSSLFCSEELSWQHVPWIKISTFVCK